MCDPEAKNTGRHQCQEARPGESLSLSISFQGGMGVPLSAPTSSDALQIKSRLLCDLKEYQSIIVSGGVL